MDPGTVHVVTLSWTTFLYWAAPLSLLHHPNLTRAQKSFLCFNLSHPPPSLSMNEENLLGEIYPWLWLSARWKVDTINYPTTPLEDLKARVGLPLINTKWNVRTRKRYTRITWQFIDWRCRSSGKSFNSSVCTNPPSLQQSLQRFRLTGLMLTSHPGATSPSVDAARLAEAQRASHAAAAARFTDLLGTVLG